ETFFSVRRMAQDYLSLFDRVLKMGELDHEPKYAFKPESVRLLYKPTVVNRLRKALLGKV
ncbi:MAG: hypothetical protein V4692_11435, partial [Bdellovibrionota bacterium]